MKLYEVTYIPDGITAVVEDYIAKKTILKAENEIDAIKKVAIKINPMSADFIKKIEGDIIKVREILMRVNSLCLMVSEVNQNEYTNQEKQKNDMGTNDSRSISLWMEGYAVTGERSGAQCIGTYNAVDLDDAVKKYMEQNPNSVDWDRFGRGRHAIWACEIFDNESDSRKSFG